MRAVIRIYIGLACMLFVLNTRAEPTVSNRKGWICSRIELKTGTILINSVRASESVTYIFAYDTEQKKVIWKRSPDVNFCIAANDENSFYLTSKDQLHQVDLHSGKNLKTRNLSNIFMPKIPPKVNRAILDGKMRDIDYYGFTATRDGLLLMRDVPLVTNPRGVDHWNYLDKKTLTVKAQGKDEEIVTTLGEHLILLSHNKSNSPVYLLSHNQKRNITNKISSQYNHWKLHPSTSAFHLRGTRRGSCSKWCLLRISDAAPDKNGRDNMKDALLLNTTGKMIRIKPSSAPKGHFIVWVMMDGFCIRYANSASKRVNEDQRLWIELYDTSGKLLNRRTFDESISFISCKGSTSRGDLVFICKEKDKNADQKLLLLQPSSLETVCSHKMSNLFGEFHEKHIYFQRNADEILATNSSWLPALNIPDPTYPVSIKAIHAYSGKTLWQHSENVKFNTE